MKKIAIIGASDFQVPLIEKAKDMGYETHVFAWAAGAKGETVADYFYPISIREEEAILAKCKALGIDGITSIGSDLAMNAVNYVAEEMGLVGNSVSATVRSTNKHQMRLAFEANGDSSPRSVQVEYAAEIESLNLDYPLIVKPTDRSGSRGITKIYSADELDAAIEIAREYSFEKKVLVEEFAVGTEYSVEYVSYKGEHIFLSMTLKATTGDPHYIETGHIEPAPVSDELLEKVKKTVEHALNSLGIENGASHSELKIDDNGKLAIIEIGGRMGGDFIGSDLVHLSTGYDFVEAVVKVAMGEFPGYPDLSEVRPVSVRFILTEEDIAEYEQLKKGHPDCIIRSDVPDSIKQEAVDSSSRSGYYIYWLTA